MQQTLEQSGDPSRMPTARSPTGVLEQLRDRIRSPVAPRRSAVRLRAAQTRLTRQNSAEEGEV